MAESDAAGPAPVRKRRLTIYDAVHQMQRSAAPLVAAMEKAERDSAPLRAEIDRATSFARKFFGEEDDGPPPPEPARPAQAPRPAAPPPPPPPQRPAFEVDPPKDLLAALREAFPSFKPTDRWWVHVESELKTAHHRSNPEAHDAFVDAYPHWSAEDLLRHLVAEGRVKPPRKPRGETTCERLRDLHVNIDTEFAETASERKLGDRIERSPGTFPDSHYWANVLQPKRQKVRAEILEAKRRAREAQRWGHFDSVGRRDEDSEAH